MSTVLIVEQWGKNTLIGGLIVKVFGIGIALSVNTNGR